MKQLIILITVFSVISAMGNEDCDGNNIQPINDSKTDFIEKYVYHQDCLAQYGREACEQQAATIQQCNKIYMNRGETGNMEDCRIGLHLQVNKTFDIGSNTAQEIEDKLYDSKVLSKILDSNIKDDADKGFGYYKSIKSIPFHDSISNEIKIIKKGPGHFEIHSKNYNLAFVYSKITLKIEGNQLRIKTDTYVKKSTAGNPIAPSLIERGIASSLSRLESALHERK